MKITTLAGAVVLSAALAAPAVAEAGGYCARRYGAYYTAPYRVHRYRYFAPYGYYAYPYPYLYRRAYLLPPRPLYAYPYARPRFRFGIWW